MNTKRPKLVARRPLIRAFKFWRVFFLLVFGGLAAFSFIDMGKEIISGIGPIAPYASMLPIVFGALAAIPFFVIVCHIICLRHEYVEFYETYAVYKKGVFNKFELKQIFPKVRRSMVYRKFFWGRIFNYGDVYIDVIGPWNIPLVDFKRPKRTRRFIDNHFMTPSDVKAVRQAVLTK